MKQTKLYYAAVFMMYLLASIFLVLLFDYGTLIWFIGITTVFSSVFFYNMKTRWTIYLIGIATWLAGLFL
jgi:hypothetical protein